MRWLTCPLSMLFVVWFTIPAYAQFTPMGLDNREIQEIQLHRHQMYAGTDQGLYKLDLLSTESGWKLLGLENSRVSSFVIFSRDSLIAGTREQTETDSVYLYATFDGGASWHPYQNGFGSDTTYRSIVDMDGAGPENDTLYAVSRGDIYRSPDKGKSWNDQFISATYKDVFSRQQDTYVHAPTKFRFIKTEIRVDSLVFAGGQSEDGRMGVLMRSSDAGKNWDSDFIDHFETSWSVDDSIFINDAVLRSSKPESFLFAGPNYIVESSTSTELYHDQYTFKDLATVTDQSEIIYAGGRNDTQGLKLFKSTNGGDHWSVFSDSNSVASDIRTIAVRKRQYSHIVYFGTQQGVYKLNRDAQAISADLQPTVQIVTPADSSIRYYSKGWSNYYKGVELEVQGTDKDGHIKKYGWAIGDKAYQWTSDTSITIDEYHFGSAGEFTIRVTALDDDSLRATPDTIRIELVEPSLDRGLLLVDGTNENSFQRDEKLGYMTDRYVDSLYTSWTSPLQISHWDVKKKGLPSREVLGRYNGVFWHADNWYGSSKRAHKVGEHKSALGDYLSVGGNLMLSGWKIIESMYSGIEYSKELKKSDFANRYLKIQSVDMTGATPPGEFIGAYGIDGYPDVMVDSTRIRGYPASFYDHMIDVFMIQNSSDRADPIFTFRCREECSNDLYRGRVVAHHHRNETFNSAFIGFPLIFLKHRDAKATMHQLLNNFGYKLTSTPRKERPESYSLKDNYPNPFNPTTSIRFNLPRASKVQLTIYNTLGQKVSTLINKTMSAGKHSIKFNASGLSSGVYIYRLKAGSFTQSRKMLLVK